MSHRGLGEERRRHNRGRVEALVSLFVGSRMVGTYRCHDVSAGGARLHGPRGPAVGDEVTVHLLLPRREPLELQGVITRMNPTPEADVLYGLAFAQPSADVEDVIHNAVLDGLERYLGHGEPRALLAQVAGGKRRSLEQAVRALGFHVVTADGAAEALACLHDENLRYDAILVSPESEREGPRDVLEEASQRFPDARRVLLASSARADLSHLALHLGRATAVLPPAWDATALARALGSAA